MTDIITRTNDNTGRSASATLMDPERDFWVVTFDDDRDDLMKDIVPKEVMLNDWHAATTYSKGLEAATSRAVAIEKMERWVSGEDTDC